MSFLQFQMLEGQENTQAVKSLINTWIVWSHNMATIDLGPYYVPLSASYFIQCMFIFSAGLHINQKKSCGMCIICPYYSYFVLEAFLLEKNISVTQCQVEAHGVPMALYCEATGTLVCCWSLIGTIWLFKTRPGLYTLSL